MYIAQRDECRILLYVASHKPHTKIVLLLQLLFLHFKHLVINSLFIERISISDIVKIFLIVLKKEDVK